MIAMEGSIDDGPLTLRSIGSTGLGSSIGGQARVQPGHPSGARGSVGLKQAALRSMVNIHPAQPPRATPFHPSRGRNRAARTPLTGDCSLDSQAGFDATQPQQLDKNTQSSS